MTAIQASLTQLGVLVAHPGAFLVVILFTVLWIVFDRDSLDWHGAAALATLCMTLLIQRAEHRDTQAIHAKLDELLRAHGEARNELTRLDEKSPRRLRNIVSEPAMKLASCGQRIPGGAPFLLACCSEGTLSRRWNAIFPTLLVRHGHNGGKIQ